MAAGAGRAEIWFVYLVRCRDGTLYTGIARDVAARIAAHDAGRGARYTRGRGPLELIATKRCKTKSEALRLELSIKRLPRAAKHTAFTRASRTRPSPRSGAPARRRSSRTAA